MTTYTRILASGAPSFRQIFLHLRDKPSEACIIHCAIGKDRTGVAIALILALAGVDAATIADESADLEVVGHYVETRMGRAQSGRNYWHQVSRFLVVPCLRGLVKGNAIVHLVFRVC